MDEKEMLQKAELERERLLQELADHMPSWTAYETVLIRMVASKLMKDAGVPPDDALRKPMAMNQAVKRGIEIGYALAKIRKDGGADTMPEGLFISPLVAHAA